MSSHKQIPENLQNLKQEAEGPWESQIHPAVLACFAVFFEAPGDILIVRDARETKFKNWIWILFFLEFWGTAEYKPHSFLGLF